jgi:glyoxylase-like metal-dependent hydrolase (beta-lactamase superfamily II)
MEVQMATNVMRVGNVELTALVDANLKAPCNLLFPSLTRDSWAPYCDLLTDDCTNMELTIPAFIVRSGGKTILIDSGIGAKDRPIFGNGRLPEAMAEIGVRPEDIDLVMATHIHIDHVGWHTTARDGGFAPTFPNATYVFNRAEFDYWTAPDIANAQGNEHVVDCVLPLKDQATVELVDNEATLTDELILIPTPGHTPAHSAVTIMSGGESAVIIGDVCHHPAQMIETGWSPVFDTNPALAAESREKLMRRIERDRMRVIGGHFAHPGFGRLVRVDGRRTWAPGL